MNAACGVLGVVLCTVFGRMDIAFYLMIAGAVFDFCDGLCARALNAYSPMGKELDSLADMISFGLLPSVMLFRTMDFYYDPCLVFQTWIPLLIAVFSGLRLAKFNVDERQTTSFMGLATPASAMICGSLAYFIYVCPDTAFARACTEVWAIPVLSIALCMLLVCEIPMFSMKIHKGEGMSRDMTLRIVLGAVAAAAAVTAAVMHWNWSLIVFITFVAYIIINIISATAARGK